MGARSAMQAAYARTVASGLRWAARSPAKIGAGAAGEALGQRHQQGAFAAEPLHQPARRDAGLTGDVGQRELVGPRRLMAR